MALKAGIVGLPNVGKSTLFNCLSSAKAQAANFPFCTIDAQMGQVSVPDERLTRLAELVHPGRIVPAVCDIVDIAGLVKGASKGEGLGNQFLGNIRECDAIIHVLRCFDNGNIVHVDGSVDPVRDKEIIDTELQLKDLETVENRLKRVEKQAKVGGDKQAKTEYGLLTRYKAALEQGLSARTVTPENEDEEACARQMFLLTTKPVLYVCNVDDASAATGNAYVEQVRQAIKDEDAQLMVISAQTEADIAELESYEEKLMFLEDLGLKESGCNRLIKAIYRLLNLETFITAGEMEVKASPTSRKASSAPRSSSTTTTSSTAPKPPCAKPASWPWRARTTWYRMATSCTSGSMYKNSTMLPTLIIQQKIFVIRGEQVMLDYDLAEMYGMETRTLKQADARLRLGRDVWNGNQDTETSCQKEYEPFSFRLYVRTYQRRICIFKITICDLKERTRPTFQVSPLRLHRTRRCHVIFHPQQRHRYRSEHRHHAYFRSRAPIGDFACPARYLACRAY